ncbi:EAL domain-containing protein [Sporosarcina sp. BI001-red]|uniref:putative bifunctional diguanylate cyclase/phosphodiesterase n=1 Tax=Sporosarcina sp. BI001-red TaxID=2282866 RepID=UPI000E221ECF|nr:EAL domain-containing protein [Sporosarcina sp. BI001-red]REB08633.1 EAL domain-containing protein [Sporosarcina sp. BI001-red]
MELTTQRFKFKRLFLMILFVVLLPSVAKELLIQIYHLEFKNQLWYDILGSATMLLFSTPIFIYLFRKTDKTALTLQNQLVENKEIHQKLTLSNIELDYNANHDFLTGLQNRYRLFSVLNKLTAERSELAILFIDLDRFKSINDTMGHLSGDKFIKLVSIRLKQAIPVGAQVFRHGGDEFVILSELENSRAVKIAESILEAFKEPFEVNNTLLYTSASIGISHLPEHGSDSVTLLKNADRAMYRAKELGGNTFKVFSQLAENDDQKQLMIENDLRKALETEQLLIHYQPVINLATGRLKSFEALVRWNHPKIGLVPPGEFIPVAERSGLINDIGTWVLESSCHQVKQWHSANENLGLAVNVSIRQFRDPQFPSFVKDVLESTQFPPHLLILEITESMMQDDLESVRIIEEIRTLGVKLAIDDFGTGYSSLSKLGFLPIDYLKIDRSFTMEMLTHKPMQSIVQTIIDMGRNLDMELIAEGIEEEGQSTLLAQCGCQFGQGYLFSKPLPSEEIERTYCLSTLLKVK